MEGGRHFHFNVISAFWFFVFLVVIVNAAKYVVNRWHVPGVTELVNNV